MIEKGVSHIAYFRLDGGSSKLYTQEYVDEKDEEIKRLNSIIKEVREYIKDNFSNEDKSIWHEDMGKILRILDKENNNEDN